MSVKEKQKKAAIASGFRKTLDYPKDKTVLDLFLHKVETFPSNIAVSSNTARLTYSELNSNVNQFANYLTEEHNVSNGDLVGVALERSEWLIVSILGILKADNFLTLLYLLYIM